MTRKVFYSFILICVMSCFMLICCGGGKYGEVKKVMREFIDASNKLYNSLDSAKDGKAVANALREYMKVMKVLSPKMEALSEKYPELEDDPPQELKDMMEEFESSMQGMQKVFEKAMQYMNDPDVLKALEEFENM